MEFIANKYFVTNLLQAKKKKTNITVYTAKHKVTTNSNIMKRKNKQDHIPFASPIHVQISRIFPKKITHSIGGYRQTDRQGKTNIPPPKLCLREYK